MRYTFGDSQAMLNGVIGPYGVTPDQAYSLVKAVTPATNLALGGQCFADIAAKQIILHNPIAGEAYEISSGTNDFGAYGTTATSLQLQSMILDAIVGWLVGDNSIARGGPGWTFSPNGWVGSLPPWPDNYPISMSVNAAGASATATFTGDSFDLGYIIQDGNTASFTLAVDGIALPETFQITPPRSIQTPLGQTSSPVMLHRSGFGAGTHTLSIATQGWPWRVSLLFIGQGLNPSRSLKFFPAPPRPSLGDIKPINQQTLATALTLAGRGYGAAYYDDCASLLYPTDFCSDGVHLNSQGNLKRAMLRP